MNFENLVKKVLNENSIAGGEASVYGPNATGVDSFNNQDGRWIYGNILGGKGMITRSGMVKPKKSKKRKKIKK